MHALARRFNAADGDTLLLGMDHLEPVVRKPAP
jgi:hypothetical protein